VSIRYSKKFQSNVTAHFANAIMMNNNDYVSQLVYASGAKSELIPPLSAPIYPQFL